MPPVKVATHPVYSYSSGTVTSKDGTVIGYRRIGHGPSLLIVQGAMGTIYNYNELAIALADDFTVFIADRRGRGVSPLSFSQEAAHIERDVEDVEALQRESGAELVFGLSSGAIIALESAHTRKAFKKVVLYEPAFYPNGDVPNEEIAHFHADVEKNDLPAAMVTAMGIVRLLPWYASIMPRPLREMRASRMLRDQDRDGTAPYASFRELIPSMRFDFQVVEERGGALASYTDTQASILLLGGTESPAYLRDALDALQRTVPGARRTVLHGLGHSGAWNRDRGGAPDIVAKTIRDFLLATGS